MTRSSDGAGEPGRPAALRGARDDEPGRRQALLLRPCLDGVHRAHGALDHGEEQGPVLVLGLEVADEGLGDQLVLFLAVEQRLVGDLTEDGHAGAARLGQGEAGRVIVGTGSPAVVAAGDEEQAGVGVRDLPGLVDAQRMGPGDALPDLRGQGELDELAGGPQAMRDLGPREGGVGLLDVLVQAAAGGPRTAEHRDQRHRCRRRRGEASRTGRFPLATGCGHRGGSS